MSAGGTGQTVCLHLIIIVSHGPTGGQAALIADEMSNSKVTHSYPEMFPICIFFTVTFFLALVFFSCRFFHLF